MPKRQIKAHLWRNLGVQINTDGNFTARLHTALYTALYVQLCLGLENTLTTQIRYGTYL